MPILCKYNDGRMVDVDFFYINDHAEISTKNCYHIILVEKGLISLGIDGDIVCCAAPCVLVLKEGLQLEFRASHTLSAKDIRFAVSFLNPNITFDLINSGVYEAGAANWGFFPLEPFYKHQKPPQRCLTLTLSELMTMKRLFADFNECIEVQVDRRWSCRARQYLEIILELIFQIYSNYSHENNHILDTKDKHVWVTMILKEIHSRYAQPLTVNRLAEYIGINRTTIEKGFREVTGSSINNYIITYRLSCARKLLATTELNVSEISYQCGYRCPAFFGRQFKSRVGLTPLKYRRMIVANRKSDFNKKC